ncbi:helix-turn-helix domain-containing protein [Nitrobacter winogradskyi]|uniref:CRP/FNR family nitrogen fixation transcriptional regulator n=2 Tax=Nitrobacter winogradskyi TaxID=913 RepID=A0ACC6AGI8_NITWI|nr:helix-turn-helix domain-containing protein [Nitrobacter winogradskyi]MCP1998958.1 CRP/FNR family nitrogen fixation transcriptional regulator [Nitrobacter winogradskyi]GEC14123.1 transcriptional regulator [Nitrobacter winogradskyi]
MHTQTISAPAAKVLDIPHALKAEPVDPFSAIARFSGVIATEFSYKKDEEIYGEGEPSEYLYQISRGAVRTYKLLSDGRRQIGAFHLPGDVFGLDPSPEHRLTAEAIVDTTVRLAPRRSIEKAAASNVHVARHLWTMTACDLRHAEDHMLLLGRKTAMERVATFLLEMDRRLAKTGMLALPMCRRDIGDYLGLTLETVSRALSQLNDQGILMFSSARQIALRNRQRLSAMEA